MKKLILIILCVILSIGVSSLDVSAKANGKKEIINPVDNETSLVPLNQSEYEYALEYKTESLGNGFAFSISDLANITKAEGNAIAIRIRNNSSVVAKVKFGLGVCDNADGDNIISYMTLTANGKNPNLSIRSNGKRTFIESRNGIVAIPAFFDGTIFFMHSRIGELASRTEDIYIKYFRYGGALCDNSETDLIVYELFDAYVTPHQDEFKKENFDLYEARILKSYGTADTFEKEADTFWGGYSYEQGTPEKRAYDKSITSIEIKKNSEIKYPVYEEKWIGDVKILESFDQAVEGSTHEELASIYGNSGAKRTFTPELIGDTTAIGMQMGDWETDYTDATFSSINVYSIANSMFDWSGAKGITIMVKNFEDKFVNMNIEFFGTESDGATFRYAVNFPGARIYAYDINTGEQWCFITNTRIFIPPHFEGWIRIPFSQYDPNTGVDPFSWVMDLDRYDVEGVYINSSMKTNSNCKLAFANLGLYYESFKQESFFENNYKSIKDCLEIKNYKEMLNNAQ